MTSYKNTLTYLYGLQGRGMKLGLANIRALVKSVGNPQKKFQSMHIAGTNGKGSTAAFLASIYNEAGFKTALYTSPHLVRFTERIRINGQEIPEARLVEYAQRLRPMIEKTNATFFEATTCIAFQYFADEQVDIAVVEVGLGGRLDSTNVLTPLVSVITNVSIDHAEFLGTTVESIAREKGGIIKNRIPCVTASEDMIVLKTLKHIASRKKARLFHVDQLVSQKVVTSSSTRLAFKLQSQRYSLGRIRSGLTGSHQVENACTAVAVIEVLLRDRKNARIFLALDANSIRRGVENVRRNTGLSGRFEWYDDRILLDVAHNVDGLRILSNALSPQIKKDLVVVFGVMKDKDYGQMCEIVANMGKHFIAVKAKGGRALAASELVRTLKQFSHEATNGRSVAHGLKIAKRIVGSDGKILITGSNYVVGEALEALGMKRAGGRRANARSTR